MNSNEAEQLVYGPWEAGLGNRGSARRPGTALVFSLADGVPVVLERKPSLWDATRYHYRFEVDITDHFTNWQDTLPSVTKGFSFRADIQTAWRISAPETAVERSITTVTKADALVRGALVDLLRPHTWTFDIEDFSSAEASANRVIRNSSHELDTGLIIFACTVHLSLDEDAEHYLRERRDVTWQRENAHHKHGLQVEEAERAHELQTLNERNESRRVRERAEALRAASRGEGGLLMHLIAQDPTQLRSVLQEVVERQDIATEKKYKILQDCADRDLLHPADLAAWLQALMEQPLPFAGPALPGAGSNMPPQVLPGSATPTTARGNTQGGTGSRTAPSGTPQQSPGDGVVSWKPVRSRRTTGAGEDSA